MGKTLVPTFNNLPVLSASTPVHTLDAYIRFANDVPMLTAEEEYEFAERLQLHQDIEAAQALIMSHLRFVIKIARGFSGYGLAIADLIQEGNIGLMKAVKRFNPKLGVRLVSFAVHWVKAEMHEFIIKNWRVVKVATTKAQRKLFFNLRNSKKRLGWFSQQEVREVAAELNVKPEDVLEMEQRLNAHDAAFDAPADDDYEDQSAFAPSAYLTSAESSPEQSLVNDDWQADSQSRLQDALAQLDGRSRAILQCRWLAEKKATLHELAAEYAVSPERIRQIENNAIKKLKTLMVA